MKNYLEEIFNDYLEKVIDLSKDQKTRFAHGDRAEQFIYDDLISKKITVELTKQREDYSTEIDLKDGDLFFPDKNLYIDVKFGRSVSMNSLNKFKGEGYLFVTGVYPGNEINTKKTYYVKKQVIKSLMLKDFFTKQLALSNKEGSLSKKLITRAIMKNGKEEGIYLNFDLLRLKTKYEDWVKTLS